MKETDATTVATLNDVLEHFRPYLNGSSKVEFLSAIADKLNRVDGSARWNWRYVQQVSAVTLTPSARFEHAVQTLAGCLDGLPVEIARAVRIEIVAEPGSIRPGALVMARSRPCARPGCPVSFVPNVPTRKFCPICRPPRRKL